MKPNAIINNVTMEEKIFKILLSYSAESKDLEQTHRELCDLFNVSDTLPEFLYHGNDGNLYFKYHEDTDLTKMWEDYKNSCR